MRPEPDHIPSYEELKAQVAEIFEADAKLVFDQLMARLCPVKD